MKTTRLGVIFCAIALALGACATAPGSLPERTGWVVLERANAKYPEIVTVMEALPAEAIRRQFPVLLQVAWGFNGLPNGMPSERDLAYGRHLYAVLDAIVGSNGVYVMTRTSHGGRTIYYYVRDTQGLSDAIRKFFDSEPPISVKVTGRDEPEWETVRNVLNGVE